MEQVPTLVGGGLFGVFGICALAIWMRMETNAETLALLFVALALNTFAIVLTCTITNQPMVPVFLFALPSGSATLAIQSGVGYGLVLVLFVYCFIFVFQKFSKRPKHK